MAELIYQNKQGRQEVGGSRRGVALQDNRAAQQASRGSSSALQMKSGVAVNDDKGLEHEADVMGEMASRGLGVTPSQTRQEKHHTFEPGLPDRESGMQVKQLKKSKKHYWVRPAGGAWQYVATFGSHAAANTWWATNMSRYPGGSFSQGSTKTRFR